MPTKSEWERRIDNPNPHGDGDKPRPSIVVTSAFGESQIAISDGVNTVSLGIGRKGIEQLIDELQTVLDMAD